ncbi:DUF2127 domain-containing protein [Frankia sp. Cppng1_Ct_nod]|uniref:DUF2127 domain-containing protein n=1 Tax=Frankia sp. Cppng1_Ct_nod TaxID=2897162 RepID=UPI0010412AC5|nr:DUF2127 domain-containing protein [Frankia sp. Cppng1_Ct_nod]
MEWNLRTCARKGHVTYRPDEPALADRLVARTPVGSAWRCLRCGDFVLGDPVGAGPAQDAPVLLRGRALRDATVLRLLAVERVVRAVLLALVAYAILRFRRSEADLQQLFDRAVPAAKPLASVLNLDLDNSPTITHLRHLLHTKPSTLLLVAGLLFGYAVIQIVEGVGLWLLQRWGEYFAAVATSVFLPLEVYELTERVTVLRVGALVINVVAVVYLVRSKRLFGMRGGRAAFEAERHSESLLEVEQSAEMPDHEMPDHEMSDREPPSPPGPVHVADGIATPGILP